ncbi:MAG TPA: HupE/UreJ family protein [Flavitalea sp.]|nr:HupE/UreJ family protein [Flavitalea sp.]
MNRNSRRIQELLLLVIACLSITQVRAHTINYALENLPVTDIAWFYLQLGVRHIIPEGLDHILFIAALCMLNTKWKSILWQATAFTAAHSITLALSIRSIISLPVGIVEPIIALSIAFVAIENVLVSEIKYWRLLIVFCFGLIHGLGFASVLNEIGLPGNQFYTSVLSFNVGVELGQIVVIIAVFGFIILPFRQKDWYRKFIVFPLSFLIAAIAVYWTVQRV